MAQTWQKELWESVYRNDDISTFRRLLYREDIRTNIGQISTWNWAEDPLHRAAYMQGRSDHLSALLEAGAQVNSIVVHSNGKQFTALHYAVLNNQINSVRILLQNGADPTIRGNWRE